VNDQEHEQNQDDGQGQTHDPGQTQDQGQPQDPGVTQSQGQPQDPGVTQSQGQPQETDPAQSQDPAQTQIDPPVEQQDQSHAVVQLSDLPDENQLSGESHAPDVSAEQSQEFSESPAIPQASESVQIENTNVVESYAEQVDTTQGLPSESSDFSPPPSQDEFFAQAMPPQTSDFSPISAATSEQDYTQQVQEPVQQQLQEDQISSDQLSPEHEHLAQVEEPAQYDQSQSVQEQTEFDQSDSVQELTEFDQSESVQELTQYDNSPHDNSPYEQGQPVATEAQPYQEPASDEGVQPVQNTVETQTQHIGHKPLADELGITDIYDPMVGKDGKVFCTAGRDAPIAEFTDEVLILHPPQRPLDDSSAGEDFSLHVDERGILLDEFGKPKKIPAATYKGCPIYYLGEQVAGTLTHYAAALAHDGSLHALFYELGSRLTTKDVYELRNKSAQGDLHEFPDIVCDI
jgi:hypothetical protein